MVSVKQEVLREATANPQFFQTAIKLNALRFLVREEDLVGIQHLDGDSDMAFLNLFGKP